MRISFDYYIFSCQEYGGISRYFYELISHLAQNPDLNVDLYSGLNINNYLKDLSNTSSNFKQIGKYVPNYRRTAQIRMLLNQMNLSLNEKQSEISHPTYYTLKPTLKRGKINVCTAFDMIQEVYPKFFPQVEKTFQAKKNTFLRSDFIICISESARQDLIKFYNIPEEKTQTVHLASEFKALPFAICPIKEQFILYTGSRAWYKNFVNLAKAFSINPNLKNNFLLVAFGGGKFSKEENEMFASLKISERVIQIGGNDQTLATLYKNASLFVYPSLYEGFGLPLLEAMQFKCPIASSNISSIPEIGGDASLYFDPNNIEDILDKMQLILNNNVTKKELIVLGDIQYNKFSWNKCAQETLNIYKKLSMNFCNKY